MGSLEIMIPSTEFKTMTLEKFCVKRHFEIGLINSATLQDENFLENLVALNKTKEKLTQVTFIEQKEVNNFITDVSMGKMDFQFPPSLMDELESFSQNGKPICSNDYELDEEYEAYSMKFKLIQVMYQQYADLVADMRRREKTERELDILAERKPKRPYSEMKSKQSTATSIKSGKRNYFMPEDYTDVEITENDLIVDDLLKNQINFYIFRGYEDINIVKYLLKAKMNLSFIIQVSEFEPDENRDLNYFWKAVTDIRNCPCDSLQNIALMKYQAPPHEDNCVQLEAYLKELLTVVKSLVDLKRQHFNYIKSLKVIDTKFTETFRAFPVYESLMNNYPLETITIPLVINSMIQEVQMKSENIVKTFVNKKPHKSSKIHTTTCPFDVISNLRPKQKKETEEEDKSFKVYDKDNLNLTLRSYKDIGYQYVQDNLNILKLQPSVTFAQQCNFQTSLDDTMHHTHDVFVPSEDEPSFTDEQIDHLINLLYLKNKYSYKKEYNKTHGNEFTNNLIFHDEYRHVQNSQPHCIFNKGWKKPMPFIDHNSDSNVYESLRPMALHWAEILKPEVLFQYLFDSQLKYLCCDYIQCIFTNSLLVRFHNDVNSFGLHTRVFNEYLRTPVGLGDFCKFTLIDDYEWLKKHEVPPQITYTTVVEFLEDQTAMRLYGDVNNYYKDLLVPQIKYSSSDIRKVTECPCLEDNVCTILERCSDNYAPYAELSANLEAILKDLEEYKNIIDLAEHCKRKSDQHYSFAAYNFGVTKFRVKGHMIHFESLDNVRLTVDYTQLHDELPTLTVKIMSENYLFVCHTPQNSFNCHVFLSDETIVVFSKPLVPSKREESTDLHKEESELTFKDLEEAIYDIRKRSPQNSIFSQEDQPAVPSNQEYTIPSFDLNHYSSLESYPIVGNLIRETPVEQHKRNLEKEVDLLKRLQNHPRCMKVSRKSSRHFNYLEKKIPESNIPISDIIKRIIDNPNKKQQCEIPKRKCIIKGDKEMRKSNVNFDVSATVPNGLSIKLLPSEIFPGSSIIRQSYEYASPPAEIQRERYRMFTEDGTLIIGHFDGGITLLMSSGREIIFRKPSNIKDEDNYCRVKKKVDEHTIRKLLARLMSNKPNQPHSEYFISRRGHLNSKSQTVSFCKGLTEIETVPYSVISMITYEGEKITIKNKKLFRALHSRHTFEVNFQSEESCFKREDGFKSTIDRDGTHHIEFPDGTTIKTVMHVEEVPIRFNKKDKMGWVLITCTFFYEHPYYKPVFFDNINSNINIRFNEYDYLNINADGCIANLGNSINLSIKPNHIRFTKKCNSCEAEYKCKLYVDPLYNNKKPDEGTYFVTVEDSYKKHFKADFDGKCKVIPTYLTGPMNKNRCYYHSSTMELQKIYLINNDLSGMVLHNDKIASSLTRDSDHDKNINHFFDVRNALVFLTQCKTFYNKFNERFYGKILTELEKYSNELINENRPVFYRTNRNLFSMFEMDQVSGLMTCLKKFFKEEVMKNVASSLSALKFHLKTSKFSINTLSQNEDEPDVIPRTIMSIQEKMLELSRRDAQVKQIFKAPIPNYFNSKVCTYVEGDKYNSESSIRNKTSDQPTRTSSL
ncbi:hypothetical protein HHI36_008209 [Cryptolaemus montrouzieri]|uniref:Uncharacterized protein n=1 Tax=Cryptolaemus montrouzieri TaxID=559131 RepID=A0ABD2MRY1_9CUCU